MPAKVYFIKSGSKNIKDNNINKLKKIYDKSGFGKYFKKDDITAIKVHFGEKGNDTYVSPLYVRAIVDKLKQNDVKPFITDTNTLYKGSRANSVDHLITAIENGFAYSVVNAPLIIADGIKSRNVKEVHINKKHFKTVKIANEIYDADSMVVISHFKGHGMAGFGGAIKNLAMGCANNVGKMQQHTMRPIVSSQGCIGCGICVDNCPVDAIQLIEKKAEISHEKCIGCGECLSYCPEKTITIDWKTDLTSFMERMSEYALGAVKSFKGKKIIYINLVINVTPLCDCVPWSDLPIVNDIGILASKDPVALDKACYDLVKKAKGRDGKTDYDKFTNEHKNTKPLIQINYAETIGLGKKEYEIIEL